jgi:hypothetical protein
MNVGGSESSGTEAQRAKGGQPDEPTIFRFIPVLAASPLYEGQVTQPMIQKMTREVDANRCGSAIYCTMSGRSVTRT